MCLPPSKTMLLVALFWFRTQKSFSAIFTWLMNHYELVWFFGCCHNDLRITIVIKYGCTVAASFKRHLSLVGCNPKNLRSLIVVLKLA